MIGHETRMVQTEASTMVDLGDKLCVLEEDLKHFKMIMTQQIQTMDKKLNVLYQAMATLQPRAEVKRSSQTLKRSSDSDSERGENGGKGARRQAGAPAQKSAALSEREELFLFWVAFVKARRQQMPCLGGAA